MPDSTPRRPDDLAELGDPELQLTAPEVESLVADFRRTRDGLRGRYAADMRDLPGPADRIATAIVRTAGETSDRDEKRRLAEDLVDLQAFVDLEGQPPPRPPNRGQAVSPILERVRWRQAGAMQFIRGDASVIGEVNAQGDHWTPIGQARAALDRTSDYREDQASGFIGLFVFIVAGSAGALAARLTVAPRFALVGVVVLFGVWWMSGWIGAVVGRATARLWEDVIVPRWPNAADTAFMAVFLASLIVVEFVVAFAIVGLSAILPVP